MGIAKYNQHCRSIVTRYTKEWERTVTRIGRWIDFKNDYKTLGMRVGGLGLPSALSRAPVNFLFCLFSSRVDPWFMESVWWVFSALHKKGLVYQGYKVMPFSTACGTPLRCLSPFPPSRIERDACSRSLVFRAVALCACQYRAFADDFLPSSPCSPSISNFEAGLNYKDVQDPAVIVSFPLLSDPSTSLLAWTTTPWTLPSNLALCVNPEIRYIKVRDKKSGKQYVVAEARLVQLYPKLASGKVKEEQKQEWYEQIGEAFLGAEMAGWGYTPLFDYFVEWNEGERAGKEGDGRENLGAFRVLVDAYVTSDSGTGIVHQAPGFGEDDYRVCLAHGVIRKGTNVPCPVDSNGRFTPDVRDFVGQHVKAADGDICQLLKAKGRLVDKATYSHSYPFCWRSDTPLIYKAVPSWFVAVGTVKEKLLANNQKTYWVPAFVKEHRFHNWLADAKDWAISRNR